MTLEVAVAKNSYFTGSGQIGHADYFGKLPSSVSSSAVNRHLALSLVKNLDK